MRISRWLFEPAAAIRGPEAQFKARVFSVILFCQMIALGALLYLTHYRPGFVAAEQLDQQRTILYSHLALNAAMYLASRSRHTGWVVRCFIIYMFVGLTATTVTLASPSAVAGAPIWLGICVIVSGFLLSTRAALYTGLAGLASYGYMGWRLDPALEPLMLGPAIYFTCSSALIIVINSLRERTEAELQTERAHSMHSAKLSAIGEMAGGIAHEINTPLAAMILNAEMIAQRNESLPSADSVIARRARTIQDVGERVAKIVRGLKRFSRESAPSDVRVFSVAELLEFTLDLCRERFKNAGVELQILSPHLNAQVKGQIIEMSQTLLNLLNNSFDAVACTPEKWVRIEALTPGLELELRISDSGSGIPPETAAQIFSPFFTTKPIGQGTGLGLGISRGLVERNGGRLYLDESLPHTCFVIRMPLVPIKAIPQPPAFTGTTKAA